MIPQESTIPVEKIDAITRGLNRAFGVTEFEDIREVAGGLGANPVFRIVVRGSAFLLRINMRAGDLERHYNCMRAAAEAGLSPRVWYASVEDRVSITDFVETVPFPVTDALIRLPRMLRSLHALPPFPGVPNHFNTTCLFLLNEGKARDEFIQRFRTTKFLSENESEELFSCYRQLAQAYPLNDRDMVSSHNDLFKPDNVLFDGFRAWLVDWEAAFLNDRYADLAVVANLIVTNEADEAVFLQEYFGQPPDAYQQARFFLMRQVTHVFYAMAFLVWGSAGHAPDDSASAIEFGDFNRRFWEGKIDLKTSQTRVAYGRTHLAKLLQNARQPRFDNALDVVSFRHAYS